MAQTRNNRIPLRMAAQWDHLIGIVTDKGVIYATVFIVLLFIYVRTPYMHIDGISVVLRRHVILALIL